MGTITAKQPAGAQFVSIMTLVRVQLHAQITKEKPGMYFSYCPSLGVYSQGKTKKAAQDNLSEATRLMIAAHLEDGTFAKWMKKNGFREESSKDAVVRQIVPSKKVAKKKIELPPNTSIVSFPAEVSFPIGFQVAAAGNC